MNLDIIVQLLTTFIIVGMGPILYYQNVIYYNYYYDYYYNYYYNYYFNYYFNYYQKKYFNTNMPHDIYF